MTSEDKDLIGEEKAVTANPDLPVAPEPEPEPEPEPALTALMEGSVRAGQEEFWQEGAEVRFEWLGGLDFMH